MPGIISPPIILFVMLAYLTEAYNYVYSWQHIMLGAISYTNYVHVGCVNCINDSNK